MEQPPQTPIPEQLFSHLLQDDADLRDIVEEFVEGLPRRLEELRQAFAALDWDQLAMLAHRLKGASGSYGYPDLSTLASTMEQGFKGQQADDFEAWLKSFEAYVDAAKRGLSET
ncbi:MAG: Hpt domain-containing protein [Phycisphaerae bacterium]|jgi:HPt (histidine-containing phosphotransfer) domain-containing protein